MDIVNQDVQISKELPRYALGKQILALVFFTLILHLQNFYNSTFSVYDVLWVLMGISCFCDAWISGIYRKKDVKSLINISPAGWGVVIQFLTLVAYPLYLSKRNKLKTRTSTNIFFILTIVCGILAIFPLMLAVFIPNILRTGVR